ncbi:MAG: hypothetical protein CBB68_03685 [Rhodospirillaceae bacterium TMED8]|nr:hypothetical protein [Magnetovibrio sp.]OUT51983.1 MAG: hypothetical protein CBB68_03685 [Rhodospirillaceae bacterium TMED8]
MRIDVVSQPRFPKTLASIANAFFRDQIDQMWPKKPNHTACTKLIANNITSYYFIGSSALNQRRGFI